MERWLARHCVLFVHKKQYVQASLACMEGGYGMNRSWCGIIMEAWYFGGYSAFRDGAQCVF